MRSKCETCKFLLTYSGNLAPLSSASAQSPDAGDYDCTAIWEDGKEPTRLIEALLNGEIQDCPHYIRIRRGECVKQMES